MIVRVSTLALACALGLAASASAGVIDKAQQAEAASHQTWSAWGGDIGVRWNRGLLRNIGVTVETATTGQLDKRDVRRHEWFNVREAAGLSFTVKNGSMQQFTGGSLQMRGGYTLRLADGSRIDLRDLSLRIRPDDPRVLDAVGGDGKAWFYTDRVMFELADDNRTLAIRAADLRISPALASRIGRPEAANWEVADLALNTSINIQGVDVVEGDDECDPYPWPGANVPVAPGEHYKADLFMQAIFFDPVGCLTCDGPGGASDGTVSWAPSSTLKNNVNNGTLQETIPGDPLGTSTALYTGYIAWWTKFTGEAPDYNPPYKNDQHPFLIWNLYRFNADGSIEQIGRSGVKHAFVSVNVGCLDSCDHEGGHALGRGCGDTYGTGNNDSPWDMGPRSEIVPAPAIWGRCGSIWDPDCTGGDTGNDNDEWTQRLKTHESQVDPAANSGATYMMDSWYLARQDINIYNSMATVTGTPHYSGGQWSFSGQSNFRLGAAIDRWVDPASPPANAMNTELAGQEGHAKVAVKVTDNGDGTWRYDYAVMNFDFARAVVQPVGEGGGPDPRVVSNKGFDSFSIPAGGTISATRFSNGTLETSGMWAENNAGGAITWTAPEGGTLDWGTMYSYSITSSAAPVAGNATLHVAQDGTPASFDVATLVPESTDPFDRVFASGFDP